METALSLAFQVSNSQMLNEGGLWTATVWSLCELLLAWINCHSSSEAKCPESKKTSSPFAMLRFGG